MSLSRVSVRSLFGIPSQVVRCMSSKAGAQRPQSRSARPYRNARLQFLAKTQKSNADMYESSSKTAAVVAGLIMCGVGLLCILPVIISV